MLKPRWQRTCLYLLFVVSNSLRCNVGISSNQWRRTVVKYGGRGRSGQAIKLFQAPRKISFTFHFDKSFVVDGVKLAQSYPTKVLNGRMWHLGGQNILWPPPTYFLHFGGQGPPTTQDLRPVVAAFSVDGVQGVLVAWVLPWRHSKANKRQCDNNEWSVL